MNISMIILIIFLLVSIFTLVFKIKKMKKKITDLYYKNSKLANLVNYYNNLAKKQMIELKINKKTIEDLNKKLKKNNF